MPPSPAPLLLLPRRAAARWSGFTSGTSSGTSASIRWVRVLVTTKAPASGEGLLHRRRRSPPRCAEKTMRPGSGGSHAPRSSRRPAPVIGCARASGRLRRSACRRSVPTPPPARSRTRDARPAAGRTSGRRCRWRRGWRPESWCHHGLRTLCLSGPAPAHGRADPSSSSALAMCSSLVCATRIVPGPELEAPAPGWRGRAGRWHSSPLWSPTPPAAARCS